MARSRTSEALFNEARATEDALRAALGRLTGRLTGRRDTSDDLIGLATGPLGQTVLATAAARALRTYPLATVLVGAGLAWLTFGQRREETLADRVSDTIEDWQARADDAREAARDRLTSLYEDMSDRGADAAAFAREKATVTADLAADLAAAFGHGLSDLGDEAADRIIAARERAYAAFASGAEAVEDQIDHLRDDADDRNFLRRHPVASAAVAVAVGAALATALQANRRDGETLAESAEALMAKARKAFDTETTAAGRAIGEAATALRARGSEAALAMVADLTDILEGVRDKGRDVADSVEDAAEDLEASVRKSTRRAADQVNSAAKRVSAQTRSRRKSTQKLADKLTRGRAN
ncbi:MAG: hypothetical protein U0934_03345 [Pseudotabrizicola sp.]|uniref:hypothetical protein n=2 Tax=Pseudotabrizicola sp. TaxID=2939647 RepID=UPI002730767F|nr:hypothetical protein [Pseudotabrizicola sp.]MDP2081464.1 hypothetical protein [Pseudotabrizicola sp.]MDZ7572977.1 hypothetical protein [Pseudotabrizicola sp.]